MDNIIDTHRKMHPGRQRLIHISVGITARRDDLGTEIVNERNFAFRSRRSRGSPFPVLRGVVHML